MLRKQFAMQIVTLSTDRIHFTQRISWHLNPQKRKLTLHGVYFLIRSLVVALQELSIGSSCSFVTKTNKKDLTKTAFGSRFFLDPGECGAHSCVKFAYVLSPFINRGFVKKLPVFWLSRSFLVVNLCTCYRCYCIIEEVSVSGLANQCRLE